MSSHAMKLSQRNRIIQAVLRRWGWKIQGQLGGHYRPLLLLTCPAPTSAGRWALRLFVRSLPDRKRIRIAPWNPSSPGTEAEWRAFRLDASWISCVAVDVRHKTLVIHHPFPPSVHAEREWAYVSRYLSYFTGTSTTPPTTAEAREVEREGY
jgi:hypothetical protein